MRAALTSIAVLTILVLVTALGAPLFTEWANYRLQIEAAFSRLTGIEATFTGPIQLQFLPSPYLRAGGATLLLAGTTVASEDFTVQGQWTQLAGGAAHLSALSLTRPTITLPRNSAVNVGRAPKNLSIDALHIVLCIILNRDLGFSVGPQVGAGAILANFGKLHGELVGELSLIHI